MSEKTTPPQRDTLHVYCVGGFRKKLRVLAQANHRTLSSEVQALVDKAYDDFLKNTHKTEG